VVQWAKFFELSDVQRVAGILYEILSQGGIGLGPVVGLRGKGEVATCPSLRKPISSIISPVVRKDEVVANSTSATTRRHEINDLYARAR
jgi:hypothetical protein